MAKIMCNGHLNGPNGNIDVQTTVRVLQRKENHLSNVAERCLQLPRTRRKLRLTAIQIDNNHPPKWNRRYSQKMLHAPPKHQKQRPSNPQIRWPTSPRIASKRNCKSAMLTKVLLQNEYKTTCKVCHDDKMLLVIRDKLRVFEIKYVANLIN